MGCGWRSREGRRDSDIFEVRARCQGEGGEEDEEEGGEGEAEGALGKGRHGVRGTGILWGGRSENK